MWQIRRPSPEQIERFLDDQRRLPLSFQSENLSGFKVDHERVLLGHGEAVFLAARRAVLEWKMFPSEWIDTIPHHAPIQVNQVVGVVARVFGVWWSNACRIVSVTDEIDPTRRFGFTYATLPGHVEMGEELFLVEWDRENQVWYEIRAVSRPNYWAVKLAYPLARWMQRRFRRDSQRSMQNAIRRILECPSYGTRDNPILYESHPSASCATPRLRDKALPESPGPC